LETHSSIVNIFLMMVGRERKKKTPCPEKKPVYSIFNTTLVQNLKIFLDNFWQDSSSESTLPKYEETCFFSAHGVFERNSCYMNYLKQCMFYEAILKSRITSFARPSFCRKSVLLCY